MNKREICALAVMCFAVLVLVPAGAKPKGKQNLDGAQIFQQHCASCHAGGANSAKPSHPVAESKQLATLATFKAYLTAPPGHMPYYQNVVQDKQTLEALFKYCKTLKKQPVKQATIDRTVAVTHAYAN